MNKLKNYHANTNLDHVLFDKYLSNYAKCVYLLSSKYQFKNDEYNIDELANV